MDNIEPETIRNVAFAGHGGAGKTILTDAILHEAGLADRVGSIEDGTTRADHTEREQEEEHSIEPSLFHVPLDDHVLNLLDLPGYPDFLSHTFVGISAVDSVGIVIDAGAGVMVNTRNVWERALEESRTPFLVVNRLDAEDVDFFETLEELRETFGDDVIPYNVPDVTGSSFSDVYGLLDGEEEMPPELEDRTAKYRNELVEAAVETDEDLMEAYFAEEEIPARDLHRGLSNAMGDGSVVPVLATSGKTETGITELLRFITLACPSPLEATRPRVLEEHRRETDEEAVEEEDEETGENETDAPEEDGDEPMETVIREEIDVEPGDDQPFLGQVFRIISDPFVGVINFARIYAGTVEPGDDVELANRKETCRVGKVLHARGEEHDEAQKAGTGDMVGLTKIENGTIGETLRAPDSNRLVEKPSLPNPMVSLAVRPTDKGAEQRLSTALSTISQEDPNFQTEHNEETNELIIRGLSSLHLDLVLERLEEEFDVEVETKQPEIPYRETITQEASAKYRHKKQSGGRGQYAEVYLTIEPLPRGEGFEFINSIRGGAIPTKFIPSVKKGIQGAMEEGIKAGYRVTDVSVEVYDGDDHPVDSSEEAFKRAASQAFKQAYRDAGATLLEPVVEMEVTAPRKFMGDITGDLNSRRAKIRGMDSEGDQQTIRAVAPLSEVLTYESQLRSLTAGEGVYELEFSHYENVPSQIQERILEKAREEGS